MFDRKVTDIKKMLTAKGITKHGSKKELLRSWLLSCSSQDISPDHYLVFVCQLLIEIPSSAWEQSCAYHLYDLYINNKALKANVDNIIEHLPRIKECLVELVELGNGLRSKKLQRWGRVLTPADFMSTLLPLQNKAVQDWTEAEIAALCELMCGVTKLSCYDDLQSAQVAWDVQAKFPELFALKPETKASLDPIVVIADVHAVNYNQASMDARRNDFVHLATGAFVLPNADNFSAINTVLAAAPGGFQPQKNGFVWTFPNIEAASIFMSGVKNGLRAAGQNYEVCFLVGTTTGPLVEF